MRTVRYSQPTPRRGALRTHADEGPARSRRHARAGRHRVRRRRDPWLESPRPSSGPQSLAPGQLPTSSPGAATGTVTSGSATVELGGDLDGTVQLTMLAPPAVYSPPPGSTAVVWTDGAQSMGITGMSFEGDRDTSDTLSLRLEVRDAAKAVVLTSSARECTITVDTAAVGSLAGTFDCAGSLGRGHRGRRAVGRRDRHVHGLGVVATDRPSRGDLAWLAGVTALLFVSLLWLFVAHGLRFPVGPDAPVYIWWMRAAGHDGLSLIGHRPGTPAADADGGGDAASLPRRRDRRARGGAGRRDRPGVLRVRTRMPRARPERPGSWPACSRGCSPCTWSPATCRT